LDRDCEAAVKLDPVYVKGHLRAGMALGLMNRPEEGLEHYIAAIEIEPHNEQVPLVAHVHTKLANKWVGSRDIAAAAGNAYVAHPLVLCRPCGGARRCGGCSTSGDGFVFTPASVTMRQSSVPETSPGERSSHRHGTHHCICFPFHHAPTL